MAALPRATDRGGTRMTAVEESVTGPGRDEDVDPRAVALDVINCCMAGRIRQIARVVTARYDTELREYGITANQVTILSVIAVLGKVSPRDLEPYLQMDGSTISRNLSRMLSKHWLAKIPAEDRRSHYLVVAPDGFDIFRRVRPAWQRAQEWAEDLFGESGVHSVRDIAARVNPEIPV